jgi:dihydroflavonol-4-reductase
MTQTALVTGATGFIGSNLCRGVIEAGYNVRVFHRSTSSLRLIDDLDVDHALGDINEPKTLVEAMRGVEVVFHTASRVDYWRGPDGMYSSTVGGTRNILGAALEAGVQRVVYTSSVAALGVPTNLKAVGDHPPLLMNETHAWNYRPEWWRYGHAKHLAEMEVQKVVARGLDVVIVNPSMVLGPRDVNRISGELVIQVARGIVHFGIPGGMNAIHIKDAVRGHLLALERGKRGERYILGGENNTFLKFIQVTAEVVGVKPPKYAIPSWILRPLAGPLDLLCRFVPMPFNGDLLRFSNQYMYYDTQKAQKVLGLTGLHTIRSALQETYDWYKAEGMI